MSDTLTALQAALAPRVGLQPVPLASQSYELSSTPASGERLLNMYAEKLDATNPRSAYILRPTAGTGLFTTLGAGPVLASASASGAFRAISGTHAYYLQNTPVAAPVDLGEVGTVGPLGTDGSYTSTNYYRASIAVGPESVVFCVPPNVFVTDLYGAPVQQVTTGSGNFPTDGASSSRIPSFLLAQI
ncbi:MAG: hypothetical protein ABSC06_30660 [Rhodopila sp.]